MCRCLQTLGSRELRECSWLKDKLMGPSTQLWRLQVPFLFAVSLPITLATEVTVCTVITFLLLELPGWGRCSSYCRAHCPAHQACARGRPADGPPPRACSANHQGCKLLLHLGAASRCVPCSWNCLPLPVLLLECFPLSFLLLELPPIACPALGAASRCLSCSWSCLPLHALLLERFPLSFLLLELCPVASPALGAASHCLLWLSCPSSSPLTAW